MESKMNRLIEVLQKKSAELNLFSAGDRLKLGEKHIPDALAVLDFWDVKDGQRGADIGTGGGIPGLVLAYVLPNVEFMLVDSTEKKIVAIEAMADDLEMQNVFTAVGRFENLGHERELREQFDFVTARAVAELPVLLEYVVGFLKVGGHFYAWKQEDYSEELESSQKAQQVLAMKFKRAHEYALPSGERRVILEFEKTAKLPSSYPRKDGVPKSKPLL